MTKFKELRSDALSTLKDVATQLVKRGEYYGTVESRKALAVGRSPMLEQQVGHSSPSISYFSDEKLDRPRL